jgi:hypothetical protein
MRTLLLGTPCERNATNAGLPDGREGADAVLQQSVKCMEILHTTSVRLVAELSGASTVAHIPLI